MIGKILRTILKIILVVITYILQIYVVNNTNFFGVHGDLCLMLVALTTLLEKSHISYITAAFCGIASDVLFSNVIGKYIIIYVLVVSVLIGLKKVYKQDSKLAIIVFSIIAVLTSNILLFVFNLIKTGQFINIFVLSWNIFKQCIIDIFLAFMIYLVTVLIKKGE